MSGAADRIAASNFEIEKCGRYQLPCVGLTGRRHDLPGIPLLDHAAGLHHQDAVCHRADHREVVADEHVGEAVPLLQVAQEIDDVALDAAVERRGRLIEHDEARLQDHGAGNGETLPLAAGEFVRITRASLGIEPHFFEGLRGAAVAVGRRQ